MPLKLTFLGGADEIGASGILVETGSSRVVVDCGLRMGGAGARDPLPDLASVGLPDELDALVVTHSHLDHTGALPLLHASAPRLPVLATAPTFDVLGVMLSDAVKIMDQNLRREEEIPLYPPEAVDALLGRARPAPFLEPLPLGKAATNGSRRSPDTVTFFPAGHILGAACVGITSPEGSVLITGDYSVTDQRTVPGAMTPRFKPDVVVTETTYGGRLHSNRALEERRLVEAVRERIEAGGKVLIPAFALGRGQEVLLILERAARRRELPPVPIYVDGLVRAVCDVYVRHPDVLQRPLRRRIQKKAENPFFGDGSLVRRIRSPRDREAVLTGGPCVIVSSSGMLSGGPSAFYAAGLLPDPENLITITGYQDEESPGRRLLDLAEGKTRTLRVAGEEQEVGARVSKYNLSAHADEGEVVAFVGALRPRDAVLVHGSWEARRAVASRLGAAVRREVYLPELGDTLELTYRKKRGSAARRDRERKASREGLGRGAPLDETGLETLWLHLYGQGEGTRPYTVGELLDTWYGQHHGEAQRGALVERLRDGKPGFEPDRKRPFLFRIVEPERSEAEPEPGGPLDTATALDRARVRFGPETALLKVGEDPEGRLVLHFPFPQVAEREHQGAMAELAAETGREVRVHPEARPDALASKLEGLLPSSAALARTPSFHRERGEVRAQVRNLAPDEADRVVERYLEETGFLLLFDAPPAGTPTPRKLRDESGRMEVNAALAHVRAAFDELPDRPRKVGKKSEAGASYLELAFVSRPVGERYRARLDGLEGETGWELRIGPSCDQQEVLRRVRELLAGQVELKKGPGLHQAEEVVRARVERVPDPATLRELEEQCREATGFGLVLAGR